MFLFSVHTIRIPTRVLDSTFNFLQEYGYKQLESHAIWVGKKTDTGFDVLDAWFPAQSNSATSYVVPEIEEFRINVELHKQKLFAIAQIHTHPSLAFHSDIDDEGSELVLPNSISIVIPNFGFVKKDDLARWEVYWYTGHSWKHLSNREVCKICQLV